MTELLDKFRGCLLGLATGDALGAPLEFMSAEQIALRHGKVSEMLGGGWLHLRPGEVTDDTDQMLCILESYTEIGRFDPIDIADRILDWYLKGPRDIGNLTRDACEFLKYGYQFERAGREAWEERPDSQRMGNGSLMRCAPTGLLHYHDELHLISESRVISGITHYDERCKLCCVCLNLALSHLLLAEAHSLVDELLEFIEPRNTVIGHAIRVIPTLQPKELRTTGYVLDTLQAALWAAVYCDTFEEGLTLLVNLGGDADTVGAVAGALLGARFGVHAIPKRWLDVLEHRERIEQGAARLFELSERD